MSEAQAELLEVAEEILEEYEAWMADDEAMYADELIELIRTRLRPAVEQAKKEVNGGTVA